MAVIRGQSLRVFDVVVFGTVLHGVFQLNGDMPNAKLAGGDFPQPL